MNKKKINRRCLNKFWLFWKRSDFYSIISLVIEDVIMEDFNKSATTQTGGESRCW